MTVAASAIAGLLVLLAVGALVFISVGAYNVAATAPHTRLVHRLLDATMERSVAVRADRLPLPPPADSEAVRHGFEEYQEMCVACHGAPGVERGTLGKGMTPRPPDLAEQAAEWNDRELFWIIKHGIKLAGMPAFGPTHSDAELSGIVAFVRRLQYMSPAEYQRLAMETETHAHAGMPGVTPRVSAGSVAMNHDQMDHPPPAAPPRAAGAHVPAHAAAPAMGHAATPSRRDSAGHPSVRPARVDAEATAKLKALVANLLGDSVVASRIREDSALRRRWESETVRRQLAKPRR